MRTEYYLAIGVAFLSAVWKISIDGFGWQALGLFLIMAVSVEWIGSIFLHRHHELTKNDIYEQAAIVRDNIMRLEE